MAHSTGFHRPSGGGSIYGSYSGGLPRPANFCSALRVSDPEIIFGKRHRSSAIGEHGILREVRAVEVIECVAFAAAVGGEAGQRLDLVVRGGSADRQRIVALAQRQRYGAAEQSPEGRSESIEQNSIGAAAGIKDVRRAEVLSSTFTVVTTAPLKMALTPSEPGCVRG
jgi:hypothetical protein